jgi:hypothetical protein
MYSYAYITHTTKTTMLPLVSYGCGTWSLILTATRRVKLLDNTMLGQIVGLKSEELTGEWIKQHECERSSPNIIGVVEYWRIRCTTHFACVAGEGTEMRTEVWWGNLSKRDLGVDGRIIIKLIFKGTEQTGVQWTALAQYSGKWRLLVNTVINLTLP